jgi:hypothetical protein
MRPLGWFVETSYVPRQAASSTGKCTLLEIHAETINRRMVLAGLGLIETPFLAPCPGVLLSGE